MAREESIAAIKAAFLQVGKDIAMKFLVSRFPFMGWAIVNPILGFVIGQVLEALITRGEMMAFFGYIDWRTDKQGKAFEEAAAANAKAQNGGTDEEKRIARENLIRVADEFFNLAS